MVGTKPEHGDTVDHVDAGTGETEMSAGKYFATRLPTLKPPMTKAPNPFKLLALLNKQQWLFFLVCPPIKIKKDKSAII